MKTEFAKAIEAGEDIVGKEVVLLTSKKYYYLSVGETYRVNAVVKGFIYFYESCSCISIDSADDFEFKHILDKQEQTSEVTFKNQCLAKFLAEADEENKRLKEQLEGAIEINKQYEQQLKQCRDDLFSLRMENARLELAALRWQMFDCEANRNIADKLLKKLADDVVETR